jgi:glycosyltransferase involved in cell wall biosynthesis
MLRDPMDRPLRVGLNLAFLVRRAGGVGTYARELIPELLRAGVRITAFVSRELDVDDRRAAWAGDVDWVQLPFAVTGGSRRNSLRSARAQWVTMPWLAARQRLDVLHGLANVAPLVAPGVATVVTLHDLIWLRHAHTMSAPAARAMKLAAIPSARTADRVIAVSHTARDDMVRTLGLDARRIDVAPHGVRVDNTAPAADEDDLRNALDLGGRPVVLCVSQKRSHKNLGRLVEAMAGLDAMLVLPGTSTPYEGELRALAAARGVADRMRTPPWLEPDQLEGLYRIATCFALPSLEEGFGLPVLEAMARGVPVCCSRATSLPEVAGDAALLFDPTSVDEIRDTLARVLGRPALAAELAERGRRRAATFTWARTAEATVASYHRALAARRSLSYDRRRR